MRSIHRPARAQDDWTLVVDSRGQARMTDKNDKPYVNFAVQGSVEEYVEFSGKFRTECTSFQIQGRYRGGSGALYIPYCDKQRFDFGSFLNDCRGFGGFIPPQIGKPIAPTDFELFRQQFHDICCPQTCPGYSPRKRRISEITRRDIVDALLLDKSAPFHGRLGLVSFLKRIWPLTSMPSTDSRFKDAEGDIWQHMVNNYD